MKKLIRRGLLSLMALSCLFTAKAEFTDFSIDLTKNPVDALPTGVTQVSYPKNGASYHGNQHGWYWYAFKFKAEGPVKITLGGCQYSGSEGYVEAAGVKIGDIATKTEKCYHQDPATYIATYEYKGEGAELTVYCGEYCPFAKVEAMDLNAPQEKQIVSTRFADWKNYDSCGDKSTATDYTDSLIAKGSKEKIYVYLHNTNIYTGGNGKVSAICSAPDKYLCGMKQNAGNESTITTSAISSVTTVSYTHRATGSNRGWGLRVKGDGDADWVSVNTTPCASSNLNTGDIAVNRTNVQLQWYNLSVGNYAALTDLVINGLVKDTRTFKNFEMDMSAGNYDLSSANLPDGVVIGGSVRGDYHGWDNFTATIPVDGAVKFTFGGCEYGSHTATIKNKAGKTIGKIDVVAACYHQKQSNVTSWTYNSEDPDTLYITGSQYLPYFKAEKTEYVADIVITYRDQNNVLLGKDTIAPGQPFSPKYTVADITVPAGQAFRGWVNAGGKKTVEGTLVNEDLELFASVSDIEHATVGSHFMFDLCNAIFYFEDHELLMADGAIKYNGLQHGWEFGAGSKLRIVVSPKSYVKLGLCTYTATGSQQINNAAGDSVSTMNVIRNGSEGATADGAIHSFYYENTKGEQDTLVIDFAATAYIHNVEVYNVTGPLAKVGQRYNIAANDGAGLMMVLGILQKGDTVYLPNGTYDFGEVVLSTISADNCVLMGESMDGTIIRNAPSVKIEGIGTTATIRNTSTGLVIQDLTIQNALDYYNAGSAGRAVVLWDKGNKTACYRVKLLSYQDTYYSNHSGSQMYFEDCEIHGTVDFLCGDASVYVYNSVLYCEKRSKDGSGQDVITANNGIATDKGYVFDRCTVKSECPVISLGRSWNNKPKVAYLLTTFDYSAGKFTLDYEKDKEVLISRWTIAGMNSLPDTFVEYNTMNTDGDVISPESNKITFKYNATKELETIIGEEAAIALSYPNFFTGWDPARNYVAFPSSTAIQSVAVGNGSIVSKQLIDGKLIIQKNGSRYNVMGQMIR